MFLIVGLYLNIFEYARIINTVNFIPPTTFTATTIIILYNMRVHTITILCIFLMHSNVYFLLKVYIQLILLINLS